MFVELDTSIAGAVLFLKALADVNVLDCLRRPELRADLIRRVETPGMIVYKTETPDAWTSFATYYGRISKRQKVVADCEDIEAILACYLAVKGIPNYVSITQPHGKGEAHAYGRVGEDVGATVAGPFGSVIDLSVACGMVKPPPSFYSNPYSETASLRIELPR